MTLAITAGLLVAGAVYLFASRELMRVLLGFVLVSHAANLVLLAAGGAARRGEPFGAPGAESADPLPQAFVLTAIVIAFSLTIVLIVLAATGRADGDRTEAGPDELPADAEDAENAENAAGRQGGSR